MSEVDPKYFGIHQRTDGNLGHIEVVPTTMGYVEADGSDIRVSRVRRYNEKGKLEHIYLQDTLGVRFADLPQVDDDLAYLKEISE